MNVPKPVYLLAGGHAHRKSPDPLLHEMLRETGRVHPSVAYIGAASGDDLHFFGMVKNFLVQAGAGRVELVAMVSAECDLRAARALLKSADVLFFSGGDVEIGMRRLCERGVIKLIRERYRSGAVLAGLSAGSILLCPQWVRWRDPDDDSTAEPFDCLGIVPVVCDMHDEEGDWEELKWLLRLRQIEGETGYGLPSGTGLRIHPDHRLEPIGGAPHGFVFHNGQVTAAVPTVEGH